MALQRLVIDGYGQVELNNVAFRRDGRIEAQCALDATDFASLPAENGMLLAVNNVARVVKLFESGDVYPVGLNYSTEHAYDERTPGLKNFKLLRTDGVCPRIGYLAVGDKFTTNCVCYDDATYSTEADFITALGAIASTALYGEVSINGSIKVSASAPSAGVGLLVIGKTTMPDGQLGIKFQVISV